MISLLSVDILDALGLSWQTMLIYIGNFIILFTVLTFVLYKPVKKMLKNKRDALNKVYDENEKLKAESKKLNDEYNKKEEELKTESARLSAEVAENAKIRADEIVAEAQEKAKAIVENAKKDAQYQKEQLKTGYKEDVNEIAVNIAQKLLERDLTEKDNSQLIEQALSEWEDTD